MGELASWSWALDGWIVATGVLCAVASALLGNFLVLRKMSMLGDAISHAVLPGLAAAFFITDSRASLPMFLGAVIVGVLTAFFTEWIRGVGRVDEGASMGVVFTSLFALGLVMIVQAADHVDLDPGCVLYGAIELTPADTVIIAGVEIPRAAAVLAVVTTINAAFLLLFFKELKISSFDPALATTSGFNASIMHYLLMTLVAVTAVASFESVGNILVVAMFVVPPAAAYMLVDRLPLMVALSVVIAAASAAGGHVAALVIPSWFGYGSTTTAGMMAAAAGGLFVVAAALGPRHGVLVRFVRHRILEWRILADDVVAFLYRTRERRGGGAADRGDLRESLLCGRLSLWLVLKWLDWRGEAVRGEEAIALTERGRARAQNLVRSHRLWEEYLLSRAGVDAGRIHEKAGQLEHFTDHDLRRWLESETGRPDLDPHGRPIPREVRGEGTSGDD